MEHQRNNCPGEQHDRDTTQEQSTHDPRLGECVRAKEHPAVQAPDTQAEPALSAMQEARPVNPQIEQGIREHGDAFRAYLELPDVDLNRDDLIHTFREFYIGAFASMDALLDALTEIRDCVAAMNNVAASWGFDDMASLDSAKVEGVARETWDIVEINGKLYVFDK